MRWIKLTPVIPVAIAVMAVSYTAQAGEVVSGDVRRVDEETGKITISHGPIKSLNMDAMTMVFTAKDPAILKGVKAGAAVTFEVENVNGQFIVTRIAPRK